MRSSSEFATVLKNGRRAAVAEFALHAMPTGETRVGFVVSKAVGNAVVRNRVRRRLREVVRANLGSLEGHALVVRAFPRAAETSSMELRDAFTRCAKKLSL